MKRYRLLHKSGVLGLFVLIWGKQGAETFCKMGFSSGIEVNLAAAGLNLQAAENGACTLEKRKIPSATCIERNRRKMKILSASDPWKYSVRAKKNHETALEKTEGFSKVIHLGSFNLTSGF